MTTYYVRKSGSSGNNGLTPATAKALLSQALALMVSGDTVYIGAGIYRANTTVSTPTGGATTSIIGDWDGSHTGDAGEVVISPYTTSDSTRPGVNTPLKITGSHFFISHLTLICGRNQALWITSTDVTVEDCYLTGTLGNSVVIMENATFGVPWNHVFRRCTIINTDQAFTIRPPTDDVAGADTNLNVLIENCLLLDTNGSAPIEFDAGLGHTNWLSGGFTIDHCTIIGGTYAAIFVNGSTALSTTYPCIVTNCLMYGYDVVETISGQIVEDYNFFVYGYNTTAYTGTVGTHSLRQLSDVSGGTVYREMRFMMGQERQWGANLRPAFTVNDTSPLYSFNGTGSLATDLYGNPRPGSGNASVQRMVGAIERGNSGAKELSVIHTAPQSLKITGPGFQDFQVPVAAGTTTVAVWSQYNSSYAGTLPQIRAINGGEAGAADATATLTGSANTWTQMAVTITATSAGIVTIRVQSNDTNGAGIAYFADFSVS